MQPIPHPRAASEAARAGEADPRQNLLERLWQGQILAFLAFLHCLKIPFDNHQAERDLRMLMV